MRFSLLSVMIAFASSAAMILVICLCEKRFLRNRTGLLFKVLACIAVLRMFLPVSLFGKVNSEMVASNGTTEFLAQYNAFATALSATRIGNEIPNRTYLIFIVISVWAIIAAFLLFRDFKSYGKLIWLLRHEKGSKDKRIHLLDAKVRQQLGVRKKARILNNSNIDEAMCSGYVRPTIYIPFNEWTDEDITNILMHEYTHMLHGDNWIKTFVLLVKDLFWFNPFLHTFYKTLYHSCEYHCDYSVSKALKTKSKRITYAKTITKALESRAVIKDRHFNRFASALVRKQEDRKNDITFKRLKTMMEDSGSSKRLLPIFPILAFTVLGFASLCFVPSNVYVSGNTGLNVNLIEEEEGIVCLLERSEGVYDLYMNGKFNMTTRASREDMENGYFPIFQTIEEIEEYVLKVQNEGGLSNVEE